VNKYAKAFIAALTAASGSLVTGLADGKLSLPDILLAALVAVAAGLATAGVKNAGYVSADQVANLENLAQAAYTAYANKLGGKTPSGDPLPAWADVSAQVRSAWLSGQNA